MGHRQERIRIETERHRIEGSITLARDGYRSRVSDVLNASERDFLTLTEVTVEPLEGGPVELHEYLTLARRHIVFAVRRGGYAGGLRTAGGGTERAGFEPAMEFNPHTRLAGECLQPLGHLSLGLVGQCKACPTAVREPEGSRGGGSVDRWTG